MRSLKDLRVLVTGAAQNIGYAIAKAFLDEGCRVLVNDVTTQRVERAVAALSGVARAPGAAPAGAPAHGDAGSRLLGFACDVSDAAAAQAMVDAMVARWGGVDIVVNNAGIYPESLLLEMSEQEWDRVMNVNVKGTFLVSKACARVMVDQSIRGHIINISSGSWKIAQVGYSHYCASKAAIVMFSQAIAMELGRSGILVNVVAPGFIENEHVSAEYKAAFLPQVPAGRLGVPEDVAKACIMLAAGDVEYMTGQTFQVDGGLSAGRYSIPLSNQR